MLLYTYLVNYRIEHLGVSPGSAFFLNSSVLLVAACAYPFFGYLADRLGFLRVFLWGAVLMAISIYPSMLFVGTASAMMTVFIMLFLTLLLAAMQGAISPLFASVFGGSWQATRCALGYSIGNGLSGGAPLIAEWAVQHAQHGLAILFVLLSLCGLLGLVLLRWAIKPVWTKAVVEGTLTA